MKTREQQLRRIRVLIGIVIAGLIGSGLSAFPLLHESGRLDHFVHAFAFPEFVRAWIAYVYEGLATTYAAYPFIGYGTDWLAFGHIVVALFVIGAFFDPVRNVWVIRAGNDCLHPCCSSGAHLRRHAWHSSLVANGG